METGWCRRGHAGYVVEGELEIAFSDRIERFSAGDGIIIASGEAERHRAKVIGAILRLTFVEDPMTKQTLRPPNSRSRLRLLLNKFLLVTGGVMIAVLIAELVLRVAGFTYFNPYIADPDVGYSLRPGAEGWWIREGRTYIRINSQGFRDREHSIVKPPDTFRIAVLGDSFAEAFQVPQEKAFWSVIERELPLCLPSGKKKVEVLNFGVSGFSTARELVLLETRVWEYSPDMIVLLVTIGNDIRDNSRALTRYHTEPLPYFVFRDGQLVRDNSLIAERTASLTFRLQRSVLGRAFIWLQNKSKVLGLVYTVREGWQSPASERDKLNEPGLDSEVYRPPATPDWEDAWRVTEALLVRMRTEVQAKGAKFLVVTGSAGIQVNPDAATRDKFMERAGVKTLFYPDERIKSTGQSGGFDVVNLAESLHDYASRNKTFVHGSSESGGRGHWNEKGHRLAGELIAREICRINL